MTDDASMRDDDGWAATHSAAVPSPARRIWRRFKRDRLGYASLLIFCALMLLSLCAQVLCNDKPLVVSYEGRFYFPLLHAYPETAFGGDFPTEADYLDPYVRARITQGGNWAIYPPNPYGARTIN
jgi:microcin C transport system permease protein